MNSHPRQLAVIVPSRSRPHTVVQMAQAFQATTEQATTLVFAVDRDDPDRLDYLNAASSHGVRLTTDPDTPQPTMVTALNHAAHTYADSHQFVGFMGDDHRPRTYGWDTALTQAASDGLAYGNDLFQGKQLPTHVVIAAWIIRTIGWMAPPSLRHLYVDNAWLTIGRGIGIRYLHEIVIEHVHPFAGKAPLDPGYVRVNSAEVDRTDRAAYHTWLRQEWPQLLDRLTQARNP